MKKWVLITLAGILVLAGVFISMLLSAMDNSKAGAHAVNLVGSFKSWKMEGRPQGEALKAIEKDFLCTGFCISNIVISIDGTNFTTEVARQGGEYFTFFVTRDETVIRMNSSGKAKVIRYVFPTGVVNSKRLPGLKCALVCYECDTGRLPGSILEGMFFVGTEDGHLKEGGILANWWLADINPVQTNVSSFYTDEGGFLYNPAQRLFGIDLEHYKKDNLPLPELTSIPGGRAWDLADFVQQRNFHTETNIFEPGNMRTDHLGQIVGIEYNTGVSNPVCRVLYDYNREGKIIEKTVCFGAQSNSVAYGYTPRGALASQKQGTILTEYRYDERNNLQQDKVQYSYDALGNVTNILRSDGRSVSLEWERGDSRETLNDFEKAVKLLGDTTKSVWDPKISTEGLVRKPYLGWIPLDSAKESTRYVIKRVTTHLNGAEISRWEPTEDSKQTGLNQGERFLVDLQGTVLGVVDSEGVLVESYQYDAWGKILSIKDGAGNPLQQTAVGNNALWQGMEYLWEAGLYNFYGSLYDPEAGCWMTQSPVRAFFQCKTREYIFCGNDPVNTVWRESPASRNQGGALHE